MDMGLWMWDGTTCCWAIVAARIYVYALARAPGGLFSRFSLPLRGQYSTQFHFQTPRIRRPDWGVLGGHAFNLEEFTFVPRPPPWTRFPPSPLSLGGRAGRTRRLPLAVAVVHTRGGWLLGRVCS